MKKSKWRNSEKKKKTEVIINTINYQVKRVNSSVNKLSNLKEKQASILQFSETYSKDCFHVVIG